MSSQIDNLKDVVLVIRGLFQLGLIEQNTAKFNKEKSEFILIKKNLQEIKIKPLMECSLYGVKKNDKKIGFEIFGIDFIPKFYFFNDHNVPSCFYLSIHDNHNQDRIVFFEKTNINEYNIHTYNESQNKIVKYNYINNNHNITLTLLAYLS
jgi:hypothetical protein